MDDKERILALLQNRDWGADAASVAALLGDPFYGAAFRRTLEALRLDALYQSPVHGTGHILRTLVHGAMGAMAERLPAQETALLLEACAYHDVGRLDDTPDIEHGARAALRIGDLTGRTGRELALLQAAVTAHSCSDGQFTAILGRYGLAEDAAARRVALLLKDADGLDRVRIWDLDPAYLRFPSSVRRAGFAQALYAAWQEETGAPLVPEFVRQWKGLDALGRPVQP